MSFWDRVGTFAKDLGGAAFSPVKFVWDVSTAPWNDDEQFNGFSNIMKSSGKNLITSAVKPLADVAGAAMPVLQKIDDINQAVVRRPLTTGLLLAQGAEGGLGRAWEEANKVSFGQAAAGFLGQPFISDDFNIYDQKQRDEMFKKNMLGKLTSGTLDLGIDIFGDVTLAGGKAAKALRASSLITDTITKTDDVERIAKEIQQAKAGVRNKYSDFADLMANSDSFAASNHPLVKNSSEPALLASAFGVAKTRDEALDVTLMALGDKNALASFGAKHAHMKEAFDKANGEFTAMDEYVIDPDSFLPYRGLDRPITADDIANRDRWDQLMTEQREVLDSMRRDFADMDKTLGLVQAVENEGSLLTRTVGSMSSARGFDKALMKVRTDAAVLAKTAEESIPKRIVRVFQPNPYNNLVQAVHFATGERPAGVFNVEESESSRELVAVASRVLGIADGSAPSKAMRGIVNAENNTYKFIDRDGVEHAIEGMTQDRARGFLNQYIEAVNPSARMRVLEDFERFSFSAIAAKHGLSPETAKSVYNQIANHRKTAIDSIREHGFAIDRDGSKIMVPLYESQTANFIPMMDFDLLDRTLAQADAVGALENIQRFGGNVLKVADVLNDAFKVGALLRLGYTVRNTAEAQLRIAATLNTFGSLRFLGAGSKNFLENTYQRGSRMIDHVRGVGDSKSLMLADRTRKNSLLKIEDYTARFGKLPDDVEHAGARDALQKLIDQHKSVVAANTIDPKVTRSVKGIGQGQIKITSRYTLDDGTSVYVFDDALGGPLAGLRERLVSSESARVRLINETAQVVSNRMKSNGWGAISPNESHYWTEWANTLNTVFRNSQISRRMAEGQSPYKIAEWLKSQEGRAVRKELNLTINDVDGHMELVTHFFNDHVPNDKIAAQLLGKELFTAENLKALASDVTDLAPIQGTVLKEVFTAEGENMLRRATTSAFRMIGTLPEDKLARQPFYVMAYRDALKRNVEKAEYFKGRSLITDQELWAVQQAAHRDALRQMKKTLFNIERRTNAASAMRLIAPFFSAYENSLKTWTRIMYNNPSIAYRGYLGFTAPNRLGIATDEKGNLVPVDQASMDDTIWITIPHAMTKIPFIGKGLEPFTAEGGKGEISGGLGISKRSLDVIFSGGIDFPIGPYVAIPVSEIVKSQPDLEETLKWAIPYGPTDAASLLPPWLRRQLQKSQGQDSTQYANFFSQIWQTEMQKYQDGLRPEPTAKEIEGMTRAYYNMHSLANLILPFAPKFNTPYRFYVDKYRQYKEAYGIEAQDKFYNDFGDDFFRFTTSLSANASGAAATVGNVQRAKKYAGLIASIAEDDPKLIGIVTDDGKTYEFSKAAYTWQQETPIAPGSKTRFREKGDPAEADKRNRAQLGWIKYGKVKSQLDMELAARGLTSYEHRLASDLKMRKDASLQEIATEYPEWYDDYLDTDGSKTRRIVRGLTKIVSGRTEDSRKFMADNRDNPTWKSVVSYLSARQYMQDQLQYRKSKSLDANDNADLRMAWQATVNRLTREDIGFEDLYNRFLSQDPVWDKVKISQQGLI